MKNPRTLLVIFVVIALLALVGLIAFTIFRDDTATFPITSEEAGTLPESSEVFDILSDPDERMRLFEEEQANLAADAPQTERLLIQGRDGGVSVRNFLKDATFILSTNEVVIAQESDFDIRFDRGNQQFILSAHALSAEQFQAIKLLSEAALLRILDVSKDEACTLAAWHVTPPESFEGQTLNEGSYPLTFCSQSGL